MNMLNNRIRFDLLNEEEQEMFKTAGITNCKYWWNNSWHECAGLDDNFGKEVVYRLELKAGEWYTTELTTRKMIAVDRKGFVEFELNKLDGVNCKKLTAVVESFSIFRPATQEEIDSKMPEVKEESFVDVKIDWAAGNATIPMDKLGYLGYLGCGYKQPQELANGCCCENSETHSWVLSGYIYSDSGTRERPFIFTDGNRKIQDRATHARFIKVSE